MDSSIFAVAKYQVPTLSVSQQDVVFCFVNTDYVANANRTATFDVSPTTLGANRFGIQNGHFYNVRNLLATNPNSFLWTTPRSGADLIANGITVILNTAANTLGQAQYLKLVDTSTPQDTDDDGMPDDFELTYAFNSQNPLDANADADGDHQTNFQEFQAGTNPQDANSLLAITQTQRLNDTLTLTWSSVSGKNYQVRASTDLVNWQPASTSIAATSSQTSWGVTIDDQRHFYKIELIP